MTATIAKKRFTVSDYHKMAEAGVLPERGVELINGEIIEMSPVGGKHIATVNRLNKKMNALLDDRAIVSIQNPIIASNTSEPEPDVAVLRFRPDFYGEDTPSAADVLLVIEVSGSTLGYDRGDKLAVYAQSGIPECWIVNLEAQEVEVFWDPLDDSYQHSEVLRTGDMLRAQYFNLELPVAEILPMA
jgi:Uma2 family endonuclease